MTNGGPVVSGESLFVGPKCYAADRALMHGIANPFLMRASGGVWPPL